MMVRDTNNPIPIQLALVVTKGSNTSAGLSVGMPGPESLTMTTSSRSSRHSARTTINRSNLLAHDRASPSRTNRWRRVNAANHLVPGAAIRIRQRGEGRGSVGRELNAPRASGPRRDLAPTRRRVARGSIIPTVSGSPKCGNSLLVPPTRYAGTECSTSLTNQAPRGAAAPRAARSRRWAVRSIPRSVSLSGYIKTDTGRRQWD
jgi:hypothetical protein